MTGRAAVRIVEMMSRGVDFSRKSGGVCPLCQMAKSRIVRSMAWQDSLKERYHKCTRCGLNFKSVEKE